MSERPTVLVTNDDGIDSGFLEALVVALAEFFEVRIAAPTEEQSWIGRAMSRRRDVSVRAARVAGHEAWAISGTPTDCINLALGHLLPAPPDLVVSGINIGYNTTLPLLLSSGTIAGALEGAHWGLPAIATSMAVEKAHFAAVTASHGRDLPSSIANSLAAAARHTAHFARALPFTRNEGLMVENLNFPARTDESTSLHKTVPARLDLGCLFIRTEAAHDTFSFAYQDGEIQPSSTPTDRETLLRGQASHSSLSFAQLGL